MQRIVENVFFALIRFEVNGDELCDEMKNLITPEMLPALFKLSKRHDLAHLIGDALDKNGFLEEGSQERRNFLKERSMAIYRVEQLQYEYEQVVAVLETLGVEYLPLKGSVLRKYYPEDWMRTSADIDILTHEQDLGNIIKALQETLGYEKDSIDAYDAVMISPSGFHVELHFDLITSYDNAAAHEILSKVWNFTNCVDGCCRKEMKDEYFYYYHVAHMARHFIDGGCGIRPFLDVWLLNHKCIFNKSTRNKLLKKGGLLKFAKASEEIAETWLSGMPYSEEGKLFEDFVLKGGVYGSTDNKIIIQQGKSGGRFKYILRRIFMPYEELKYKYPILKRHKYLYPLMLLRRCFFAVFTKKSKQIKKEMQISAESSKINQEETIKLIDYLGLKEI